MITIIRMTYGPSNTMLQDLDLPDKRTQTSMSGVEAAPIVYCKLHTPWHSSVCYDLMNSSKFKHKTLAQSLTHALHSACLFVRLTNLEVMPAFLSSTLILNFIRHQAFCSACTPWTWSSSMPSLWSRWMDYWGQDLKWLHFSQNCLWWPYCYCKWFHGISLTLLIIAQHWIIIWRPLTSS